MTLDDRPAIDQLLDPDGPVYCAGCGRQRPDHTPECLIVWPELEGEET